MSNRVDSALRSLRRELAQVERQRRKLADAIAALEKLTEGIGDGGPPRRRRGRSGRLFEAAIQALRARTEPMDAMELVAAIQRSGVDADRPPLKIRASLVSTMRRRTDVFSKPRRGVYGLKEWEGK